MTTFKLRNQVTGFLLLTFTLPAVFPYAQPIDNPIWDVAMPAPNLASLDRYGDVPVSHYTGVPRIDVPIYTLEEGPLTLPVFLSCHARGIKVAETASRAGAGWTLQAGGMICRTVLGYPDERSPYGYYFNGKNLNGSSRELIQLPEGEEIDTEPDIFAFSIPDYSGKFYIDKDHNGQLVPRQELKITWSGHVEQFTLLTPEGNRHIFGKHPQSNALAVDKPLLQDETFENTSSWYLARVEVATPQNGNHSQRYPRYQPHIASPSRPA